MDPVSASWITERQKLAWLFLMFQTFLLPRAANLNCFDIHHKPAFLVAWLYWYMTYIHTGGHVAQKHIVAYHVPISAVCFQGQPDEKSSERCHESAQSITNTERTFIVHEDECKCTISWARERWRIRVGGFLSPIKSRELKLQLKQSNLCRVTNISFWSSYLALFRVSIYYKRMSTEVLWNNATLLCQTRTSF